MKSKSTSEENSLGKKNSFSSRCDRGSASKVVYADLLEEKAMIGIRCLVVY